MDKRILNSSAITNHQSMNKWEGHVEEYLLSRQKLNQMSVEEKRETFGFNKVYEDEKWKPVVHKNGFIIKTYEVSQYGKVRNLKGK